MNCHPCDRNRPLKSGWEAGIRTSDPLTPSQVRYQAAPRPDSNVQSNTPLTAAAARARARAQAFGRPRFAERVAGLPEGLAAARGC